MNIDELELKLKAAVGSAFIRHVRENPQLARAIFHELVPSYGLPYPEQKILSEWLLEPNAIDNGAKLPYPFNDKPEPS